MVRPAIDLTPFHNDIQDWVEASVSRDQILARLEERGMRISSRTLIRALQRWHIRYQDRRPNWQDSAMLRETLKDQYNATLHDDKTLAAILSIETGQELGPRRVARLRKEMGLQKWFSAEEQVEHNEYMAAALVQAYDGGDIASAGKESLYTWMRDKYEGIRSRNRLRELAVSIDPAGFQRRRNRQSVRGKARQPLGPNHIWSVDGYCNLEYFDIQIYAAIDAYSRYIVWIYIGLSGRQAVSVMAQYLRTVKSGHVIPAVITSDRGKETPMMADAHVRLRRLVEPDADLNFTDCFSYGTSKQNQRIESWWSKLSRFTTTDWKNTFDSYVREGIYDRGELSDRVAFLAIYMPIIREKVSDFVRVSSNKRIRKQGEHVVAGVPATLYHYPVLQGAQDCGFPIADSMVEPLIEQLGGLDVDEYLPRESLLWCTQALCQLGFETPVQSTTHDEINGTPLHKQAYIALRQVVAEHVDSGMHPDLQVCERPTGGLSWQPHDETIDMFQAAGFEYIRSEAV